MKLRQGLERQHALDDSLRADRARTYNEILRPFILLLSNETAWRADPKNKGRDKDQIALQQLLSLEYREKAFQMSLVGSDAVVKAYNDLMQYFYSRPPGADGKTTVEPREIMALLGRFLLAVRRSMGNEATKLDHWDMLEWFLTDARKYRG